MSTLKACKADGYYRPDDCDPEKRKLEVEKRRKEGTLKVRKQGARKIRFEMPFHVRCTQCSKMIAKGVRFNAVRKKAGRYLGTLIFQFTMPCPSCKNTLVIKTDPKNCEYLLMSGCIKYNDEYDEGDLGTVKIQTPEEGEALNRNPFLKLETQKVDIIKAEEQKPILTKIIEEKKIFKDDFMINQTLRRQLKLEKNVVKKQELEKKIKGLDINLLPVSESDKIIAQSAKFKEEVRIRNCRFNIRDTIRFESIFKNNTLYEGRVESKDTLTGNHYTNTNSNLLNKKHRLDRHLQLALENNIDIDINKVKFSNNLKINLNNHIIIKKKI